MSAAFDVCGKVSVARCRPTNWHADFWRKYCKPVLLNMCNRRGNEKKYGSRCEMDGRMKCELQIIRCADKINLIMASKIPHIFGDISLVSVFILLKGMLPVACIHFHCRHVAKLIIRIASWFSSLSLAVTKWLFSVVNRTFLLYCEFGRIQWTGLLCFCLSPKCTEEMGLRLLFGFGVFLRDLCRNRIVGSLPVLCLEMLLFRMFWVCCS